MDKTLFENLNDEQLEAVTSTEGYVRVIAGAGSGKTRSLSVRYAHLVKNLGISTANILCVTFTNKAAGEMRKRIRTLIGEQPLSFICTFHSLAFKIIQQDYRVINQPPTVGILDEEDQKQLMKQALDELEISSKSLTVRSCEDIVRLSKSSLAYIPDFTSPSPELLEKAEAEAESDAQRFFCRYLLLQRKCFLLDFYDLINMALYILRNNEECRSKWQKQFQYIMVDEFQDVNEKQFALSQILSDYHKNLFVVGDPDQTIYSWRGAKVEYIVDFERYFPAAKTVMMIKNYRSCTTVIRASNSLISKNAYRVKKELVAARHVDGSAVYFHAKTSLKEAEWVRDSIFALLDQNVSPNEIAILYRNHSVSRPLEEKFISSKIPYEIYSGVPFYSRKEVKVCLSYLRLLVSDDDLSFERTVNTPPRQIGKKKLELLKQHAEKNNCSLFQALCDLSPTTTFQKTGAGSYVLLISTLREAMDTMPLSDVLERLMKESGYEELLRSSGEDERLDNLAELKRSVHLYETQAGEQVSISDYLNDVALLTSEDAPSSKASVKLMTIHTSKGLEFNYVFLVSASEGVLPSSHANTWAKLEEERRLAYVAYTRAIKKLFVSDSEGESSEGKAARYPSRFIFNTEKENLHYLVELPQELITASESYIETQEKMLDLPQHIASLATGVRVTHQFHGDGTIVSKNDAGRTISVQFDQYSTERTMPYESCLHLTILSENLDLETPLDKKLLIPTETAEPKEEVSVPIETEELTKELSIEIEVSSDSDLTSEKEETPSQPPFESKKKHRFPFFWKRKNKS